MFLQRQMERINTNREIQKEREKEREKETACHGLPHRDVRVPCHTRVCVQISHGTFTQIERNLKLAPGTWSMQKVQPACTMSSQHAVSPASMQ